MEARIVDLGRSLRDLDVRIDRLERSIRNSSGESEPAIPSSPAAVAPVSSWLTTASRRDQRACNRIGSEDTTLIAVPNLAAAANDREAAAAEISERFAAIWSLAATGSSPELIARATGQPIGQIELILGLRREIDGNRTKIPHARHT